MPAYYIESSAWLKRYKSEIGSDVVSELLTGRTADDIFVTSHLSVLEVSTVAARLLKGRAITPSQYERVVGTFTQDLSMHAVVILPLFHTLVQESIDLLPQYPLRTADALQFATALRVSRAVAVADQPFHVVSADKEIIAACAGHDIPQLDPESPSALSQLHALRRAGPPPTSTT